VASAAFPGAALFACDWNSVRSPMAEGIAKKLLGTRVFIQSAGARGTLDLDGFAVAVCREIGVDIAAHAAHSFDRMREWGDDLAQFDLVVALTPAAQRRALEAVAHTDVSVEYWPTLDPTDLGETRDQRLAAYRQTRDQIRERIMIRFGLMI
jgi:Protein-tyrosine-phosphatase